MSRYRATMGSKRLLPTVTERRLDWLAQLDRVGVARRNSVTGYHTMQLKWTEWAYTDGSETISETEYNRRFPLGDHGIDGRGDPVWEARWAASEIWRICGETLTRAGREILKIHRSTQ